MGVINWPGRTDKSAFHERFQQALQQEFPDAQITLEDELELEIVFANGTRNRVFLRRAYDEFLAQPGEFDAIAARWLAMIEPEISADIDLDLLVPMIKDRAWVSEVEDAAALWIEDYNEHRVIVYAEHRKGFHYCAPAAIEALGQPLPQLRQRALDNLAALSQRRIEEYRAGYFINAGGNFEASLVHRVRCLSQRIWRACARAHLHRDPHPSRFREYRARAARSAARLGTQARRQSGHHH
jgi:hypothetical protein